VKRSGFTLIEVLVALAIAAVGLAAVLSVVTNSSRNAIYLHDKTFATWIGLNHLTEVRFSGTMPSVDRTDGELDYAGQHWKWQQTVTQTEVPGMRRLDVSVRFADSADDAWLATVTGFVGRTQLASSPSTTSWEGDIQAGAGPGGTLNPGTPANPGTTPSPGGTPNPGGARPPATSP
jgi:general secretion pathway protein I